MPLIYDDRTETEQRAYDWLVVATYTDSADNHAWACRPEHHKKVLSWVAAHPDVCGIGLFPRGFHPLWNPKAAHVHIYVVHDNHPAVS